MNEQLLRQLVDGIFAAIEARTKSPIGRGAQLIVDQLLDQNMTGVLAHLHDHGFTLDAPPKAAKAKA